MKKAAFTLLLLLSGCGLFAADTFSIGGKAVAVPPPEGYVRVTDEMPLLKRFFDQLEDPVNDTLAVYVPKSVATVATERKIPELSRYFLLKVNKSLRDKALSPDDFEALRTEVVAMQDKTFEEVSRRSAEALKNIGSNVGREFDIDMAIRLSGLAPLRPHHSGKGMVAFSILVDYGVSSGTGGDSRVVAVTSTLLDVSGSLALLYAFGPQKDLEWTRSASMNWGDAIFAANGLPVAQKVAVRGVPAADGFRWGDVVRGALIVAVAGVLAAMVLRLARRRKKP